MSMLASNFRKKTAAFKDPRMSMEAEFGVGYATGILSFDFANGMKIAVTKPDDGTSFSYNSIGIVDGSMVSCVGRAGCGKTTFVLQSAGQITAQFDNSMILHEDIEGGVSDMRKRKLLGMDTTQFNTKYICRNTGITTENFFERIKLLHDEKLENKSEYIYDTQLHDSNGERIFKLQPTVVILDSLAMLMPEDLTDGDELAGSMAATSIAKKNTQLIKRIIPMLKAANIIFFVINHILPDPSPIPKKAQTAWLKMGERCPGGETAIYLANNFLRFDDKSKLTPDKEFGISGIFVDILLVKSRTNNAGRVVKLVFDYDNGFDNELSLFLLMQDYNKINGTGVGMYFRDRNDMKFSKKTLKKKLAENEEFAQLFSEVALETLEELINTASVEEQEYKVNTSSIILNMMKSVA